VVPAPPSARAGGGVAGVLPNPPAMSAPAAATRPPLGVLLRLAWPIVVSRAAQVVVGISDALMVAHLGPGALAATTAGAFNAFSFLILPMGIVFIVASFSSQLAGRGDLAAARRYGFHGLLVAGFAQLAALAMLPLVGPALGLLDYAPEVGAPMARYLEVRLLSIGAAAGLEALANYYGGLGNTRLPMRANVAAMALNVAGNWVLIDGHLGAPALGVTGAAAASSLATWLAFLGLAGVFLAEGRRAGRLVPALRWAEFRRLLRFGVPSGLNWFFEFFAFSFFVNVVVAGLGTTALAAMMAVFQLNSVAFMPAFALASAGAILVGQAIGAGRRDDVPGVVRLTFATAGSWEGLVGLAYVAAPALLMAPFAREASSAAELVAVGSRILALSAVWQLADAAVATLAEALRAAGDTAFTLWARLGVAWAVFVPGSWFTVRVLGGRDLVATGWIAAYLGLLALVLLVRFRGGAWRRIVLVEPEA
jgi:multidrug resistance protein, MATE family